MTEKQDKKVCKELGESKWCFVGHPTNEDGNEDMQCNIYQTNKGVLFAANVQNEKVFFEVYEEDGVFTVY